MGTATAVASVKVDCKTAELVSMRRRYNKLLAPIVAHCASAPSRRSGGLVCSFGAASPGQLHSRSSDLAPS